MGKAMHDREIVYISGKITDDPNYREKFNTAEQILRDGYDFIVINPAKKIDEQLPRKIQMVLSIDALCACDTIYMLPDWEESTGARAEKAFAESIGINIRYYDSDDGSSY
jgi:hypothetical protein